MIAIDDQSIGTKFCCQTQSDCRVVIFLDIDRFDRDSRLAKNLGQRGFKPGAGKHAKMPGSDQRLCQCPASHDVAEAHAAVAINAEKEIHRCFGSEGMLGTILPRATSMKTHCYAESLVAKRKPART